jgi:hypothetical protein
VRWARTTFGTLVVTVNEEGQISTINKTLSKAETRPC